MEQDGSTKFLFNAGLDLFLLVPGLKHACDIDLVLCNLPQHLSASDEW